MNAQRPGLITDALVEVRWLASRGRYCTGERRCGARVGQC